MSNSITPPAISSRLGELPTRATRGPTRRPFIPADVIISGDETPLVAVREPAAAPKLSLPPPGDVGIRNRSQAGLFGLGRRGGQELSATLQDACERLGLSHNTKFNCYAEIGCAKPLMTFDDACAHLAAFKLMCGDHAEWLSLVNETSRLLSYRDGGAHRSSGLDALALMHTLLLVPKEMRTQVVRDAKPLFEVLAPSDIPVALKLLGNQLADGEVGAFCDVANTFSIIPRRISFEQTEPSSFSQLIYAIDQASTLEPTAINNLILIKNLLGLNAAQRILASHASTQILALCRMNKLPLTLSHVFFLTRDLASRWASVASEVASTISQAPIYLASNSSYNSTLTPFAASIITLFHAFIVRDQNLPPPPYEKEAAPLPPKAPAYECDDAHVSS